MSDSDQNIEEIQDRIQHLVSEGELDDVSELAETLHPSDLADLVEGLPEEERVTLVSALPAELASETLAEMDEGEDRSGLLAALPPQKRAELLDELADDDAADLIRELEPADQQRVLASLPDEQALRGLLLHAEDTAGGLMTTELVSVKATLTAAEALAEVRRQGREVEEFYTVFVVDEDRRLLGTLRLDDLIIADPGERIDTLIQAAAATVRPDEDQERVGRLISRYNLASIAVVDEADVLLGRITFDDVIDVIEAEHTEDILRFVGVSHDEELHHSWPKSVRARLPWLMLHLLTATLAASVILVFQDTISQVITLAFLAPIIAAMGGSSGTQSLAVTIRRITIEGSRGAWRYAAGEMLIGLVNGAVLGAAVALLSLWVDGDPMLGVVVLVAMWGNQIVAAFAGAFIPATLDRLGVDPSVASSVFVQTLTDLCGFFLLLGLASRLLL